MKKFFITIIILGALGAGAYYAFIAPPTAREDIATDTSTTTGEEQATDTSSEQTYVQPAVPEISDVTGRNLNDLVPIIKAEAALPLVNTYTDKHFHISFKYPKGFIVRPQVYEGQNIIGLIDPGTGIGLQVEISEYEDKAPLTAEKIRSEVPLMPVNSPTSVVMGKVGKGVAFISKQGNLTTREVWFTAGNALYQVSAPIEFDQFTQNVMNTWKFI